MVSPVVGPRPRKSRLAITYSRLVVAVVLLHKPLAREDFVRETRNESLAPCFIGSIDRQREFGMLWDGYRQHQRRSGSAIHCGSTYKPDGDGGTERHVLSGRQWHGSVDLSMEEKWCCHRWREFVHLHNVFYNQLRQWRTVLGGGKQFRWKRDE